MKNTLLTTTRWGLLAFFAFIHSVGMSQNLKLNQSTIQQADTSVLQENSRPSKDLSNSTNAANQSPLDAVKGKREDVSKRDAFSKHYINEDGSFTALIGAGPIHFEKNGQFLDIDTKIKTNQNVSYPYANTENLFESYFGATSHIGIKNKTQEGELIEFLNTQMYWEVNGQAVNTQNSANSPVRIEGDKVFYDNIYGTVSAEFTSLVGKRKLNYIIPNQQALSNTPLNASYLVFSEDILLPFGWTHTPTEQGISIKNQFGLEIYLYENPVSTDITVNELDGAGNTVFETSLIGNTLTIKTKVKTEWLLSNERVFPVMVDPTVTVTPNNTTRWSLSVYSSGAESTSLYFGYQSAMWLRSYIRFNTSSIANGSIVGSVVGWINITAGTGTNPSTRQWQFANAANPVTNSGTTLYNSTTLGYSNIVTVTGTGWRSSALYIPQGNTYVEDALVNGAVNLAINPSGTYTNGTYMTVANHTTGANRPYLTIVYYHALTVTNAETGASHANDRYPYDTNSAVTITSGTRTGYVCTGWTGTGNVPATGTASSVSIIMTQNSTIDWKWALQPGNPASVIFHNYGGTEQLTFNNSRIETSEPIFRLSHGTDPATDYEIEINTNPTFTAGTNWIQTFTGTYPITTQTNFTFNNGFSPTNNTTYYVRARVRGEANAWSAWTTETYSFTYQTPKAIPDWLQTTQAQFQSNALSGTTANASNDVVVASTGGNVITNGDFETNITGWTKSSNYTADYLAVRSTAWASNGTASLRMYHANPGSTGYFSGDYVSMYQTVDLTGISTLQMDANYVGSGTINVQLRVYIAETSQATGISGTQVHSWTPSTNTSSTSINIDLSSYAFTGNKIIKLVYYVATQQTGITNVRSLYFDNVRTTSPPAGTITSTPIHLASVQGALAYEGITWNQTLGGDEFTLKVQQSANGTSGWADVPGYTAISETGNGEKTVDLSGMTAYPHIRLVGSLDGAGVVLHDWSIQFKKDDCASETTWDGSSWSNGVPISSDTKIIFEGNYNSFSDAYPSSGGLIGCSVEVQVGANVLLASGHSVTIDNEIKVVNGASFTLENNANLVQIEGEAENEGVIAVKRNSTLAIRQDATGWSSPVAAQNVRNFSTGTLKKRYYIYNGYGAAGTGGSSFKALFEFDPLYPMPNPIPTEWPGAKITDNSLFDETAYTFQKGWGYSIRVPNNWSNSTPAEFTGTFTGEPHNGDIEVLAYGKYTMVGNPYPSAINAEVFFDDNTAVKTLHFWTHYFPVGHTSYNNNYVTYTRAGGAGPSGPGTHPGDGTPPNEIIPVAQGFVVENGDVIPEESNISWPVFFNNGMRTTASTGVFFKNNEEIERHRFWLSLSNENEEKTAQILIGYITGATQGEDHQIDGKRKGSAPLYSLIEEEKYTVQGRSLPFSEEDVVPLGFTSNTATKYTISIDDLDGLFLEGLVNIYLRDHSTGVEHNLMESDYLFESVAGEFLQRFEIIYKTEEILDLTDLDNNLVQIYQSGQNIVIRSDKEKILSVHLYDLSGKNLHKNEKVNASIYQISKTSLATQVLVVKVLTENGEVVTKKIINH